MPAPRKYPEKLKERAILLCLDALRDPERSKGCFRRIGEELDINSETLRGWVRQAQIDDHQRWYNRARPQRTTASRRRGPILRSHHHVGACRRVSTHPPQNRDDPGSPRKDHP